MNTCNSKISTCSERVPDFLPALEKMNFLSVLRVFSCAYRSGQTHQNNLVLDSKCQNLKMSVLAKIECERPYSNPDFASLESAESTHV